MGNPFLSLAPLLGFLALLVLLAWGIVWAKKRWIPTRLGSETELRLVSHLALGPQQRVAVVEVRGPQGTVQLTLGVTPQHVRTLHTQNIPRTAEPPTEGASAPSTYQAALAALPATLQAPHP